VEFFLMGKEVGTVCFCLAGLVFLDFGFLGL
jgi:hypothetical protein